MTRAEYFDLFHERARRYQVRIAEEKQCAIVVKHRLIKDGLPCCNSATRSWQGEKYCVVHYPPTVKARHAQTRQTRIRKLEQMLRTLEQETKH